jgi:hypothetical protein
LAEISLGDNVPLIDLRDAKELVARQISTAHVTTRDYVVTRRLAGALYDEGIAGFLWVSALDARWTHATLFSSRVASHLKLAAIPKLLYIDLPELQEAARAMSVSVVSR